MAQKIKNYEKLLAEARNCDCYPSMDGAEYVIVVSKSNTYLYNTVSKACTCPRQLHITSYNGFTNACKHGVAAYNFILKRAGMAVKRIVGNPADIAKHEQRFDALSGDGVWMVIE